MKYTIHRHYGNRRLYLKGHGKRINLSYVADLIKQGHEVEIIDYKTKKDITRDCMSRFLTRLSSFDLNEIKQLIKKYS